MEGFQSIFLHIPNAIGSNIAIAPMLFIKDESNAAMKVIEIKNWISELAKVCNFLPNIEMNPDFSNPLLISRTKATVMTAGWENPEKALSGSI